MTEDNLKEKIITICADSVSGGMEIIMKFGKRLICLLLSIAMIVCMGCSDVNSDSEAITIIWPSYLVNMMGYTAEQQVELIAESNENNQFANSIYANEDGSITFEMNEKQLQRNLDKFNDNLKENIETAKQSGIKVEVGDHYQAITFEFTNEVLNMFTTFYVTTASNVIALQMMSGEEPDNWNLQIKIVDENTGKIIKEGTIPEEEIRILPDDWEE